MLAALPIASELKTPYFSTGEATEVTGSKGTRFSFRTGTDTYSIAAASMPWCVENFGKVWTIIYADYAWGQSTNQESKLFIEKAGGKVLASIPVPLDTKDFVPYLAQIPAETEVVLPAFIGSLSVAFYTQAKSMGIDKKVKMFSSSASLESIDPGDIQGAAEGVYFFENFPRMLAHKNDEYHKEFNRLIGIDDVYCREIGGTRVMDKSHGWQAWEDIFAIKQAIEASGYKTRKDIEGAIQALEGMQMKNSLAHPAGRQAHPQGGSRRHHRLLHQPRGERKVRGQEAHPQGGAGRPTCRCGTTSRRCRCEGPGPGTRSSSGAWASQKNAIRAVRRRTAPRPERRRARARNPHRQTADGNGTRVAIPKLARLQLSLLRAARVLRAPLPAPHRIC